MANFWDDAKNTTTTAIGQVPIVGNLVNTWSGGAANTANNNAQQDIDQAKSAYNGMTAPTAAPITAQTVQGQQIHDQAVGTQAGLSPQAQAAQTAQMGALSSLAANGGRNAASDANLAQIRSQEGAQAQGQRGAVMADAARRGQGNGNTALLGQLSGNQAAQNTGAMQDAQVAGQQANTALQAGQGAAGGTG